jgi:hypothetical protein
LPGSIPLLLQRYIEEMLTTPTSLTCGTRHIHITPAASRMCRYLFCVHPPRSASGHSDPLAAYSPGSFPPHLSSLCFAACRAVRPHQHTMRRGRPSATLPNHTRFHAHRSTIESSAYLLHPTKMRLELDDYIAT